MCAERNYLPSSLLMDIHNCKYCRILVGVSIPEIVKRNLKIFTIVTLSFTQVACDIYCPLFFGLTQGYYYYYYYCYYYASFCTLCMFV
jgi:hypothetical protein